MTASPYRVQKPKEGIGQLTSRLSFRLRFSKLTTEFKWLVIVEKFNFTNKGRDESLFENEQKLKAES